MSAPATEFMLTLSKALAEKKLAESTVSNYIRALIMLNNKKPFKSLTFLRDVDAVMERIKGYADNTQKAILGAICSVLGLYKEKGAYKKVYARYFDLLKDKKSEDADVDKAEKTTKEKDNWIEWPEVLKRRDEIKAEVDAFAKIKTLDATQFQTVFNYLLLCLYTMVPPRRNQDYLNMVIVSKWNSDMAADKNYLDLSAGKFVFNKYKTAKSHGQQIVEIPSDLLEAVHTYIARHPLKPKGRKRFVDVPFLVTATGEPIKAVNGITRALNRIFKRKVGSSLLRHIYLSNKYDIKDIERDASLMAHSVSMQRDYLRRDDSDSDTKSEEKTEA